MPTCLGGPVKMVPIPFTVTAVMTPCFPILLNILEIRAIKTYDDVFSTAVPATTRFMEMLVITHSTVVPEPTPFIPVMVVQILIILRSGDGGATKSRWRYQ